MAVNTNTIPDSWASSLGGREASGWLAIFVDSPKEAVSDLIWDNYYFGPLNLVERSQLLSGWLDLLGNSEHFADRLDIELTDWVEENWGRFERRTESLVSAWSCLCSVVEFSAKLPEDSRLRGCAEAIRLRFNERQEFLGSFSSAPAADPLGIYLAVVAEFQGDDRSLISFWHRLCDLPDGVPFYHARYAMLGLRRLRAADPIENGTLRAEIVFGLLRLARAFDRLVRERGLPENVAKTMFRRIAAQLAAAYPNSPRWAEHGLTAILQLPDRAQNWVLENIPSLADSVRRQKTNRPQSGHRSRSSIAPNPNWAQRARELAPYLRRGNSQVLPEVQRLIDEQRRFSETTGDIYYIVRTLCNFASRVLPFNSQLALDWAQEARKWDPYNDFTWNTVRTVFLQRKQLSEAASVAWVAWKRFPEDVVARTGLAEVLKATGRYDEAMAVYRQTMDRFPENVVARCGLAEMLKATGRYDEAVVVYRQTVDRFPEDVVGRCGLAEMLKATGRYDEAVVVYRQTVDRFPENVFARCGLADTLRRAGQFKESEAEYRRSIKLGYVDAATFVALAYLVLRKGELGRTEALGLVDQVLKLYPRDQYALSLRQKLEPATEADLTRLSNEWSQVAIALFDAPSTRGIVEHSAPVEDKHPTPPPETKKPTAPLLETVTREAELPSHDTGHKRGRLPFTASNSLIVTALTAEAYFYRTWAKSARDEIAAARRQKAAELLAQAERLSPKAVDVLTGNVALSLDEGDESVAYDRLSVQLSKYPAAASLLVLKARLDRDRARKEKRSLNDSTITELCVAPQRLCDLNPALAPLFDFQKGLAALALRDGADRISTAASAFSGFRRTLAQRADEERVEREQSHDRQAKQTLRFHEWLQRHVNSKVFVGLSEPRDVRPDDIPAIESSLVEHIFEVEEVEDVFADRLAFRTI